MFFRTVITIILCLGMDARASDSVPGSGLLKQHSNGVAGFKVKHLSKKTASKGVSIHAWKKVFLHDFEKKLKHQPSEELIQEQELRLENLLKRIVIKYTSDEEGTVYSIEIDTSDLSGIRISAFKPVKTDRFDQNGEFLKFKDSILCAEDYCFFPVIFTRQTHMDVQWNSHYVKIGGKKRRVLSVFECENFKGPFSLNFSFKTPDVEIYTHREMLFMTRFENDILVIKEGRLTSFDSHP